MIRSWDPVQVPRLGNILHRRDPSQGGVGDRRIDVDLHERVLAALFPRAVERRDIDAFLKAGNSKSTWPQPLAESHPDSLLTRRSGPIVAVISGSLPATTAHKLLNQINYQADVVWNNPQGYISDGSKVARLILGIFALTGILGGAAILLGLFLGGGRALYRIARGQPASAFQEETEFIRLNLED